MNHNLSCEWSTAKDKMGAAIEAWTAESCAIAKDVAQLQPDAHAITEEASQLDHEVVEHCVGARGHIQVWTDLTAQDAESLRALAAQHRTHSQEDAASEARRREAGAAFASAASTLAVDAAGHATRATEVHAAIEAHGAASAEEVV